MVTSNYPHSDYFAADWLDDGQTAVLRLRQDAANDRTLCGELQDAMLSFVEAARPQRLIVDFADIRRMVSATINTLLLTRKSLKARQASLLLCRMDQEVRRIFQTMRLEGLVFPIVDTVDQAQQ